MSTLIAELGLRVVDERLGRVQRLDLPISAARTGPRAPSASRARGRAISVYPSPKPVASTIAGETYTGGGFARSTTTGRKLCLKLREWSGSSVTKEALSCISATGSWQAFPEVPPDLVLERPPARRLRLPRPAPPAAASTADELTLASGSAPVPTTTTAPPPTTTTTTTTTAPPAPTTTTVTTTTAPPPPPTTTTMTHHHHDHRPAAARAAPPRAATLYASTSGSDSASGSASAPYRTVAKLLSALAPGQTGCLASGQTFAETLGNVTAAGTGESARITLTSTDRGNPATIAGRIVTKPAARTSPSRP